MGIFMNTRHSASESGHVTAELEALVNEATLGTGNYVFEAGNKFAITVTPVTGKVNVSNGVFSWCGRLGGVDEFETVQYTPPGSETLYKKIVIGAKYSKTPGSLVENIYLEAIESEVQSSESAAAGVTLTLDSDEIKPDTVSAFLPLWEFTANSKTHSTPVKKFNTVNDLKFLLNKANELSNKISSEAATRASAISNEAAARSSADNENRTLISNETTARTNADNLFDNRLQNIEKRYELLDDSFGNGSTIRMSLNDYRAFAVTIRDNQDPSSNERVHFFPAAVGSYVWPLYKFTERSLGGFNVAISRLFITVNNDTINVTVDTSDVGFSWKKIYGIK